MKKYFWRLWFVASVLFAYWWLYQIFISEDKSALLIGQGSHGHYQIELSCKTCHTSSFSDEVDIQLACVNCHSTELKEVDDSHPKSKFTDPRNADRTAKLDARLCVTCHTEHQREYTLEMGLTVPKDFCFHCHQDISEDRPSHLGLAFDSCSSAGCHNFHDNLALYEDFLVEHADEKDILKPAELPIMNAIKREIIKSLEKPPLKRADIDMPTEILDKYTQIQQDEFIQEWEASAHARASVNCSDCHQQEPANDAEWLLKPEHGVCAKCHKDQAEGFYAGKHGMRVSPGLKPPQSPLKPAMSDLAFKEGSLDNEHGCNTCHSAHDFNIKEAAVDGCLACHDDNHSKNYKNSMHFQLWQNELDNKIETGKGVSCASCHMPRMTGMHQGKQTVQVEHNQNRFFKPNEKVARPVCMHCHGLAFVLDALADETLIENNFQGTPATHIPSIDWAIKREKQAEKKNE